MNDIIQRLKKGRRRQRWLPRMFALCVLATMLAAGGSAHAQIVNGDFELLCGGSVPGAFQFPDCVDGSWRVSRGTPDISTGFASNSTLFTYMWGRFFTDGEGIFIQCPD